MLSEKVGVTKAGRRTGGQAEKLQLKNMQRNPAANKSLAKTMATTSKTANVNNRGEESFMDEQQQLQNLSANKFEMIEQAWKDPKLAGDISAGMTQATCCRS